MDLLNLLYCVILCYSCLIDGNITHVVVSGLEPELGFGISMYTLVDTL